MYIVCDADEGDCRCGNPRLKLLTHKRLPDGYPAFLICFACREVTEVKGDDGETVQYRGGRRKRFSRQVKFVNKPRRLRKKEGPPGP